MHLRISALLLALATISAADVLTLRSGRVVEGQYLGGDARMIRLAIGDRVESYPIVQVSNLQFSLPDKSSGSQDVPPPAPVPPPDQASAPPPSDRPDLHRRDDDRRDDRRDGDRRSGADSLPSGTAIVVRLIDSVDSERDYLGKTYRASVDEPVLIDGRVVIPRGADAIAKLVDDKQSGKIEGRTVLTLDLAQVQVNGRMVDITTGDVSQASGSRGARSAKVIGGATALGAIIGALAGGGKGAAIGAGSGAAVGTGAEVLTKGQKVRIPSETRLTFTLQQSTPL